MLRVSLVTVLLLLGLKCFVRGCIQRDWFGFFLAFACWAWAFGHL